VNFVPVADSPFLDFRFPGGGKLSSEYLTEVAENHHRGSHQQDHREVSADAVFLFYRASSLRGGGRLWHSFPLSLLSVHSVYTFQISPTPWRCCLFPLVEFAVEAKALTVWAAQQ
jgi:hypothetical protein